MKPRLLSSFAALLLAAASVICAQRNTSSDLTEPSAQTTAASQAAAVSVQFDESQPDTTTDSQIQINATFTKQSLSTTQLALNYWLYTPNNPTENMPLILYLHGGTDKGDDLDLVVEHDGFPKFLMDGTLGDIDAYVVIPQLPSSQKGWSNIGESIIQLISAMEAAYGIDAENISLTGHSMGGTGVWDIALRYPKTFARIAPMSGSVKNTADHIGRLSNTAVWAVVGSEDNIVDPSSSVGFIGSLQDVNPSAKITVLEGVDHFGVPNIYLDKSVGIMDWLVSK